MKVENISASGSAHDIHIYRPSTTRSGHLNGSTEKSDQLDLVLHTIFDPRIPLSQVHIQAEEIQRALRQAYPQLSSVVIHTEPPEQWELMGSSLRPALNS